MREIKFRGYVRDVGWVYGYYVKFKNDHHEKKPKYYIYPNSREGFAVAPKSVGQYVGVTDKNYKRIFEGDLVNWIDSDGNIRQNEVKFYRGGFILCNTEYHIGTYSGKELEVVGNICEGLTDEPERAN